MPNFIFQLLDGTGRDAVEREAEFNDFQAARQEARRALGSLANDGLPEDPANMMSVEVLDADRNPLLEVRLTFDEIRKDERVGGMTAVQL